MAYEILSESYGRRLPKITAEADSTDDLVSLGTDFAEGSTCTISDKTYTLDKVQGWVEAGASPSPSGGGLVVTLTWEDSTGTLNKTWKEIWDVFSAGGQVVVNGSSGLQSDCGAVIAVYNFPNDSKYNVRLYMASESDWVFETDSENGYPSAED